MNIKIHNTLSGKKETFKPITPGELSVYSCGPTVYDYAHIGNLRAYVFSDTLRRVFEANGYQVKQVVNITDIGHLSGDGDLGEDKMSKAIKREGKEMSLESMKEIGRIYTQKFIEDLRALNILLPAEMPKASEHIREDLEIISLLEKKNITYKISDGIYFDTSKFEGYGKLGNIKVSKLMDGARVAINAEKKNPADFCVWKFDDKLGWESPWGKGFPGWHIECSAMSRRYLGQPFDIHTGGIDHIPVHHNNEIAQSEAAYGTPLANYWMHVEFLNMSHAKMAKSAGNFITLKSLVDQSISPLAYRYWLLTADYKSPIEFSPEAVASAQTALIKLVTLMGKLPDGGNVNASYKEKALEFMNDDLNSPKTIALVWEIAKDKEIKDSDKKATILFIDKMLGLKLSEVPKMEEIVIPGEIQALADAREDARKAKDWAKADALREEIRSRGFDINDTEEGIEIIPF